MIFFGQEDEANRSCQNHQFASVPMAGSGLADQPRSAAFPCQRRALVWMAALVWGCAPEPESTQAIAVVSVLPHAYFVESIAGDKVRVEVMIPPGASPATYEPTVEQLKALAAADLYVKVGHPHFAFERAWLGWLVAENPDLRVVNSSEGARSNESDPHVWLSPRLAARMARNIAGALAAILPEGRDVFDGNLRAFLKEIEALDADLRRAFEGKSGKRIYVFHPAWGYLLEEYGLEQVAIEQGAKEPGVRSLRQLIRQARGDGVKVIFVQPQFSRQSADLIAGELGVAVEVVDPLARDWLDNLKRVGGAFGRALDR
ncbi:MAG: metal ABC transporter solute-binding protein, Zn/Mn family [Acidobacteriota bacterium]